MINWQDQVQNGALSSGTGIPSDPPSPNVQWARYLRTTTGVIYVWTGAAWVEETSGGGADLSDVTPQVVGTGAAGTSPDASRADHVHATGAGTPSTQAFGDAAAVGTGPNAATTDHKHAMPALGTGATQAAAGNDSRLSDARTPTAHKTSHQHGGSDVPTLDPRELTFHGASVYNAGTQGGSAGVRTFDSEDFDTDAYHSTGSNTSRLTIPAGLGGYYLVRGFVYTGSAGTQLTRILKNGATVRGSNEYGSLLGNVCVWIGPLVAGDYVEVYTDTTNTTGHASAAEAQNSLTAVLLGV